MNTLITPTAEPFLFHGGSTGCLLVHGYTASPKEMRWMGEYLAGEGFTALGIRLTGHATRMEDLRRTRWRDWLACVEDGWHLLEGVTERVFMIGLSMGGALSLLFAAEQSEDKRLAGVIAMATPIALPDDPRVPFLRLIQWIKPTISKGPPDFHNPEAARERVAYPVYPTHSLAELRDLLAEMRAALPRVSAPVLLVNSRQDTTVPVKQMETIYELLGSADKSTLLVEDSGHIIPREPARQVVFEAAVKFMRSHQG